MRLLANENFPGGAVMALEANGHDIVWIRTAAPGSTDQEILAWAVRESRVLLTFDKDFGELAWHVGCQHHLALYCSGCRCRQRTELAPFSPQGSTNEQIGPDTSW